MFIAFRSKKLGAYIGFLALCIFCLFFIAYIALNNPSKTSATISINNPHKGYSYNYKGNLHAHSNNSDGSDLPSVVGQWYSDNGYDFYALTDHNYLTPDPGTLGILWMGKSEEDNLDGNTAHLNHINITTAITSGTAQQRIDNAISQGGKTALNHIDRADKRWTAETIRSLNNVLAIEIFNGNGDQNATGTWDSVLSSQKTVWGTANDDSHNVGTRGDGYIVVNSSEASPTNTEILNQMAAGNFYASRGFDLSVSVAGTTISASTTNGNKIRWIKKNGAVIKTTNSTSDTYSADGSEGYIRIEILDGSDTPKAWSQPVTFVQSPIYRFLSYRNNAHFYTISESEKNYIIQNWANSWQYEGIAFFSYNTQETSTSPVYRFWSDAYNGHFYTISESEKNFVIANWPSVWSYEGVAYYAYSSQEASTSPVYRFWSDRYNNHFYTSSESEKNFVIANWPSIWKYEGPVYYVK